MLEALKLFKSNISLHFEGKTECSIVSRMILADKEFDADHYDDVSSPTLTVLLVSLHHIVNTFDTC